MLYNGLLITSALPAQEHPNTKYRGVAYGKPWPLENLFAPHDNQDDQDLIRAVNDLVLSHYFYNNTGAMVSFPPAVITDMMLVTRYHARCLERNLPTRVLLCATDRPYPVMDDGLLNQLLPQSKFLGYDYAFSSCDFSPLAINEQEIIAPSQASSVQSLNVSGLFDTLGEAEKHIKARNDFLAMAGETYVLVNGTLVRSTPLEDSGDFVVFKVHELEQNAL